LSVGFFSEMESSRMERSIGP